MPNRHRVHTFKHLIAAGTTIVALIVSALMFYLHEWVGMVSFFLIAILFGWIEVMYGSVIVIGKDGIKKIFLGFPLRCVSWGGIEEVGIIGTKIFNGKDAKRHGDRYIYFSPKKLDDNERFQLAMKWPPKDMIYLYYTRERIDQIQVVWNDVVDSYNAGDVFF